MDSHKKIISIDEFVRGYLSEMNLKLVTITYNEERNVCILILQRKQGETIHGISINEVSSKYKLKRMVEGIFGCECLIDITWVGKKYMN